MHFATLIPNWSSLDSVRRTHSDLEAAALVFFALLVLFDILAHLSTDDKKKTLLEKIGLYCFAIAVLAEVVAYPYGQRNDILSGQVIGSLDAETREALIKSGTALAQSKEAETKSGDAIDKAGKAQESLGNAENEANRAQRASSNALGIANDAKQVAHESRQEADSFEKDIVSAKQLAADAESHLADALRQVAQAEAELNRIRSPRSITNAPALIAALTLFKGSEYTLNVFQDDESIQFTKVIDDVLGQAGWIRKQPEAIQLGIPSLDVFGQGIKDAVPVCVETGIQVHVHSIESLEALRLRAVQDLPKTIQAAIALRAALAPRVSPSDERNVGDHVSLDKTPAAEGPVLICIGKKP
jgi:hypothetical protein